MALPFIQQSLIISRAGVVLPRRQVHRQVPHPWRVLPGGREVCEVMQCHSGTLAVSMSVMDWELTYFKVLLPNLGNIIEVFCSKELRCSVCAFNQHAVVDRPGVAGAVL